MDENENKNKSNNGIVEKLKRNEYIRRFLEDYGYRTLVIAVGSFIVNVLYGAFNILLLALYHVRFYGVIGSYYIAIGCIRLFVVHYDRKLKKRGDEEQRFKVTFWCGIALFILDIFVISAVSVMIIYEKPVNMGFYVAIVSALYTTVKVVLAVKNLLKSKKFGDSAVNSLKQLSMIGALVSVFILEINMISVFGTLNRDMRILNAVVGAWVCIITVIFAISMIVRSRREKRASFSSSEENAPEVDTVSAAAREPEESAQAIAEDKTETN